MTTQASQSEHASHPDEFPLAVGQDVCTRDAHQLGTVTQVLKSHFEVAREGDDRYWLSKRTVESVEGSRVELVFVEEELDQYRGDEPVASADSPMLDASLEAYPDQAAVDEQRHKQERGYEAPAPAASR